MPDYLNNHSLLKIETESAVRVLFTPGGRFVQVPNTVRFQKGQID